MNLRSRDRIALGIVVMLAAVGAFYMLVLKPEQDKATSLQAAITTQQQALSKAESDFAAGRAAQASLKADAAQWAALKQALPAQSDIPALLRTLERNAQEAHVHMQAITLSGASGSAPTAASPTPTAGTSGVANQVPLQLTFQGGYAALNRLVKRLDGFVVLSGTKVHTSGPLLSISSVSLSGAPLTVQLSATIYQLQPPPATTSPAGG